ncbi:MAG: DUF58 domain-containing protein [Lachnospiraceae bacterium]
MIQITQKQRIPIAKVKIGFLLENVGTGKKYKKKIVGSILPLPKTVWKIETEELEFGLWKITGKYIWFYEWMGWFSLKKKWNETRQFMIFPTCYETTVKIGIRTRLFLSDGEQYHPQMNGDDPTEIFKLREYQMGDGFNKVHWKLSAKNDILMVKEMSLPIGCNIVFFLNVESKELTTEQWKSYWELVSSISNEILQQECSHFFVWFDQKNKRLLRKKIFNEEVFHEFWYEIISYSLGKCNGKIEYINEFKGDTYASWIELNEKLELLCNGVVVTCIKEQPIKEQLLELELIL